MAANLQYDKNGKLIHYLSIEKLKPETFTALLARAKTFLDQNDKIIWLPILKDKVVANLFFENSTRTRVSFELAAKHLGASVVNFDLATSSLSKGETLADTINNIEVMDVDAFVIRHQADYTQEKLVNQLLTPTHLINAGDGCHEHPTQALLDVFTMQRYKVDLPNRVVTIVGDISHSRVAGSLLHALKHLGVKEIRVAGPKQFLPESLQALGVKIFHELDAALKDADIVMTLRIQKERMQANLISDADYHCGYGITEEKLKLAKPDAIVMHPGPMNRGVEIVDSVADGKQSVILQQAKYGVVARMAVMAMLLE